MTGRFKALQTLNFYISTVEYSKYSKLLLLETMYLCANKWALPSLKIVTSKLIIKKSYLYSGFSIK